MWENTSTPRGEGYETIVKQGWRIAVHTGVSFKVPRGAEIIPINADQSATGQPYTLVRLDRNAVHIHGATMVNVRDIIVGNVHVCLRVIWPKDANVRGNGTSPWRNYILYVDIWPNSETATWHLKVYPEGTGRKKLIMLGEPETDEFEQPVEAWATRSANWKPAWRGQASGGNDQLLTFGRTQAR
jgi:hypothetical protein